MPLNRVSPETLPLFAFLAAAAALWSHIRGALNWFRSLVIQRVTLNGKVAQNVNDYLFTRTRVIRWGDILIGSNRAWIRPLERIAEVAYERSPTKPLLSFWKKSPLVFWCPSGSTSHGNNVEEMPQTDYYLNFAFIRGTIKVPELLREAMEYSRAKETTGNRYRVHRVGGKKPRQTGENSVAAPPHPVSEEIRPGVRLLHWKEEEIGERKNPKPFDSYAQNPSTEEARKDFQQWLSLKQWYLQRDIPWRRGYLLQGPPGTGKTSLVRALAQEADLPVYAYDLSTLDNEDFNSAWMDIQANAPCVALIEDVDGVFKGRENVVSGSDMRGGLSFDCLLNAIGGIQTADGVAVFITTNQPEHLDPALVRPGRVDRTFTLDLPTEHQRESIITRILGNCPADYLNATQGLSAAETTEWAVSKALHDKWNSVS